MLGAGAKAWPELPRPPLLERLYLVLGPSRGHGMDAHA